MNTYLSIIIPCYNEQEVIEITYERVKKVLTDNSIAGEIIFINDGSRDNTLKKLTKFAEKDTAVKILSFSRNFGHQPAITAGLAYCSGEYAAIIDADLQDPPELIPDMLKTILSEHCNVVYGVRLKREGEIFFKIFTAKIYYKLINYLSDVSLPKNTGDFRLIDKKIIDEFRKLKEKNKYIRGLISWIGFKQFPYYYARNPRLMGKTKYPLSKMLKFASNGLIYFSKKPLSLAVTLGFFCILIGVFLAVYVIVSKVFKPALVVSGWASTVIIIIFFGGVQLLSIGALGRYIGCIFDEVKNRPEYIIDQFINFNL